MTKKEVDQQEIEKKLCGSCKHFLRGWCSLTEKNIREGQKACKHYKECEEARAERLESHPHYNSCSSDYDYCEESKTWERPIRAETRFHEPS